MGRVFEKRKHKMFKRYGQMARQFTRVGKEIAIAVKAGGGNPDTNARLRICIQNAKAVSMPKDRVDAAIEKASGKADTSHYHEVIYEGKGPFGIGLIVETATDNPTRTVSNLRVHFNRNGGELGNSGSQSFNFEHKGVFRISTVGLDMDDVELNLIDAGLDNIEGADNEDEVYLQCQFSDFGSLQKAIETLKLPVIQAKLLRIPNALIELSAEQKDEVNKMIEKIQDDEDVQEVYTNMAEE
ncbi:MAG: YebC/PmpR family DNA-binding transcriptional regulator [Bacteroidetes bacterium]|nr:YebC/PmpR family DNA-binding transcriptional regulator [Bacteroidota bacterium]PHX82922.1 MAG: YebC/PmpR family DNA-binding transcriptional regulator [Flavobacteriales bacterium]